jgi:DNA-binding NtrC family response regulator
MFKDLASRRPTRILIVDDNQNFHLMIKTALKGKFEFRSAYHGDEALVILKKEAIDIVLMDVQMRTPNEGFETIPKVRDIDPEMIIIMSTGLTDVNTLREAIKLGVHDYIPKDFSVEQLQMAIESATERRKTQKRDRQSRTELRTIQQKPKLIGSSPQAERIRMMIQKLRRSHANILITGESGTGKEVVARLLRGEDEEGRLAPFISIDSSTIQSSTAESVLFGYEKGAFTGAEKQTRGLFEEADGGIIYFDEIGNMPLDIQAKLLRVIQEKEILRMGSSRTIPLDFRVVAATNKDLEKMAQEGQFKEDLLQRINVLPIALPPLRERKEDLPELIRYLAERNHLGSDPLIRFSEEAMEALLNYDWPGNIRELSNALVYAQTMSVEGWVEKSDLPSKIRDQRSIQGQPRAEQLSLQKRLWDFEKSLFEEEYKKHDGNVSKMAIAIDMDRSHLHQKLKHFGIHRPNEKKQAD